MRRKIWPTGRASMRFTRRVKKSSKRDCTERMLRVIFSSARLHAEREGDPAVEILDIREALKAALVRLAPKTRRRVLKRTPKRGATREALTEAWRELNQDDRCDVLAEHLERLDRLERRHR